MHIIDDRRQKMYSGRQIALSLISYAIALQIFAHGLHAQLLTEKIPLGKSFSFFILSLYFPFFRKHLLSLSFSNIQPAHIRPLFFSLVVLISAHQHLMRYNIFYPIFIFLISWFMFRERKKKKGNWSKHNRSSFPGHFSFTSLLIECVLFCKHAEAFFFLFFWFHGSLKLIWNFRVWKLKLFSWKHCTEYWSGYIDEPFLRHQKYTNIRFAIDSRYCKSLHFFLLLF